MVALVVVVIVGLSYAIVGRFAARPVAKVAVAALWKVYKSQFVLGMAIIAFSGAGVVLIIWSHKVTGWTQAALLGFGTSLLIVGTVELGILGVLNKIIDPDQTSDLLKKLSEDINKKFATIESKLDTRQSSGVSPIVLRESSREIQEDGVIRRLDGSQP